MKDVKANYYRDQTILEGIHNSISFIPSCCSSIAMTQTKLELELIVVLLVQSTVPFTSAAASSVRL
jgi:hypothetical protein